MPKKENSTEDKALLSEMCDYAIENDFISLSELIDNKAEHSFVENDANLGSCLMMA